MDWPRDEDTWQLWIAQWTALRLQCQSSRYEIIWITPRPLYKARPTLAPLTSTISGSTACACAIPARASRTSPCRAGLSRVASLGGCAGVSFWAAAIASSYVGEGSTGVSGEIGDVTGCKCNRSGLALTLPLQRPYAGGGFGTAWTSLSHSSLLGLAVSIVGCGTLVPSRRSSEDKWTGIGVAGTHGSRSSGKFGIRRSCGCRRH